MEGLHEVAASDGASTDCAGGEAEPARSSVRSCPQHPMPLAADICRGAIRVVRSCPPIESARRVVAAGRHQSHACRDLALGRYCPVGVQVEWRSFNDHPCGVPDSFAPLPRPLWPGEELTHAFEFPSPQSLGDYVAEFSIVQRGGPRFDRLGSRAKLDLAVTHPFDGGFQLPRHLFAGRPGSRFLDLRLRATFAGRVRTARADQDSTVEATGPDAGQPTPGYRLRYGALGHRGRTLPFRSRALPRNRPRPRSDRVLQGPLPPAQLPLLRERNDCGSHRRNAVRHDCLLQRIYPHVSG